jgi:hypothetical protein
MRDTERMNRTEDSLKNYKSCKFKLMQPEKKFSRIRFTQKAVFHIRIGSGLK